MSKKSSQVLFMVGFLVYMLVLYLSSFKLSPQSKAFPMAIMGVAVCVVAVKLLTLHFPALRFLDPSGDLVKKKGEPRGDGNDVKREKAEPSEARLRHRNLVVLLFLLWLAAFPAGIYYLGYTIALAVWTFVFMVGLSRINLVKAVLMTACIWAVIYVLFGVFLGLHFPAGALFK